MEITVKIEAPLLVDAINSLAVAIAGNMELMLHNKETPAQVIDAPQQQEIQEATQPVLTAPPVVEVPTAAQTYSLDQLAVAGTQLMDAGKQGELISLLGQFGVQALTALPKEQYGSFATALRQMGAKI